MTEASSATLDRPEAAGEVLTSTDAIPNPAVKDIAVARKYYEDTLGFECVDSEADELLVFRSGKTAFWVYRSEYAGTNQATAMSWPIGDRVGAVAEALAAKGVRFEHYDLPGTRREGDVHIAGDLKIAWFKDPDGNILSIVSG